MIKLLGESNWTISSFIWLQIKMHYPPGTLCLLIVVVAAAAAVVVVVVVVVVAAAAAAVAAAAVVVEHLSISDSNSFAFYQDARASKAFWHLQILSVPLKA